MPLCFLVPRKVLYLIERQCLGLFHLLDIVAEACLETDFVCSCSNCQRTVRRKREEVLSADELASLIAKAGEEKKFRCAHLPVDWGHRSLIQARSCGTH